MLIDLKNDRLSLTKLVNNTLKIVNTTRFLRSKVIVIYRYS